MEVAPGGRCHASASEEAATRMRGVRTMRKLIGLSLSLALALSLLAVLPTSAANVYNERGPGRTSTAP